MIKENAYAKINLFLDVCSKRDDGFHDIKTVMQSISFYDELSLSAEYSENSVITIKTQGAELASDRTNLVYRAVEEYLLRSGISATVDITLIKNIPISAGLGGGSSDAAAALRAMNRRFNKLSDIELLALAVEIGSDVPFCIDGETALCLGRGEMITKIPYSKRPYLVVAIGNERVSTPQAYAALDSRFDSFKSGTETGGSVYFDILLSALKNNRDIPSELFNVFEQVLPKNENSVQKIKAEMKKQGATTALMSGSGPSVFGIFEAPEAAFSARDVLANLGYTAFCASFS